MMSRFMQFNIILLRGIWQRLERMGLLRYFLDLLVNHLFKSSFKNIQILNLNY